VGEKNGNTPKEEYKESESPKMGLLGWRPTTWGYKGRQGSKGPVGLSMRPRAGGGDVNGSLKFYDREIR